MAGRKIDFTLPTNTLDDLFSSQEERDEAKLSKIRDIPLSEIDDFPDHPFKVREDEDMFQLVESVKERGVITPATVRQKEDGRYELISGHRRKKACELAGFETLRCEVVDLDRDEATILMVESNFQRSQILPSEKAYAYKMRLDAMKRQAGRPRKENLVPVGQNYSREELASQSGESQTQIQRYADDFLIGVIGSKEDARQVKSDVGAFIKEHLHLEMSPEKTLITHGSDFAHFLGYLITVSREQNSTRTKTGFTRRTYVGKVKLYVPKEKWLNRLLSYGALKISYDKTHGNKEVWEPVRRPGLIRLDDIEILNQYNAEVRGMYNYYRLANNATVLNAFLYVMKFSMYKTFAGKYRTSMRKIIRKYCHNGDFTVSYPTKNGTKSLVFYNQGMRHNDKVVVTENPDIIGRANENRRYTRLTDRLQGHICEFCGAETEDIEIHHVRRLKDLSGKAEWERQMIARKRKTMALCHSCHVKLHNGKLD